MSLSIPEHDMHVSQLLRFNGRLLHGCPVEIAEPIDAGGERTTLLINIWLNHKPVGLAPLPRATSRLLRCRASTPILRVAVSTMEPPKVAPVCHAPAADGENRHRTSGVRTAPLRIPVCEGMHQLRLRLPKPVQAKGGPRILAGTGTTTYYNIPFLLTSTKKQ